MSLLVSSENPAGHTLIARLGPEVRVMVQFFDEESSRDITPLACDLILVGMQMRFERQSGQSAPPVEEVEIARVHLEGAPEDVFFGYVHPATQVTSEFTWIEAQELLGLGISFQVTSGVAHEAAEIPPTPEGA